jgi:SH3-like domain-containing protein
VARLQPGVVGRVHACEAQASWCEVQLKGYKGWLKRADLYGLYTGEAVTP